MQHPLFALRKALEFLFPAVKPALRFQQRAQGPSNTNALAAASSPALTAVVAQSEYANLQRVGGNYWASAETLGQICVNGNPDGKDPQTLIEDAVAGITAPVTQ